MFLPSGTLANQLAVRRLARGRPRVLVQAESHLVQRLGGRRRAAVRTEPRSARAGSGDVHARGSRGRARAHGLGPRRDGRGRHFDRVARAAAPRRDVRPRSDARGVGARAGTAGRPAPGRRAALRRLGVHGCSTGGVRGALRHGLRLPLEVVLLGERRDSRGTSAALADLYQERRMFGGALHCGLALRRGRATPRRRRSRASARRDRRVGGVRRRRSRRSERFAVERVEDGTSRMRLTVRGVPPGGLSRRGSRRGASSCPSRTTGAFWLTVNETWSRTTAAELAAAFRGALA